MKIENQDRTTVLHALQESVCGLKSGLFANSSLLVLFS